MYIEIDEDNIVEDRNKFLELARTHILKDIVMFDDRGLFILKDESSIVLKTKLWNGVAVYILPKYRHTKALKEYYSTMFSLVEGDIMGFTEANSTHNKVLLKRHNLLGYVYLLNRSNE